MSGETNHYHQLLRFKSDPDSCGYIRSETACMEHRVIVQISAHACEQLIMRGWRRFGVDFFRPACPACAKCRSLRVDVPRFEPNKSQRRTIQKNAHLRVVIQPPTLTDAHIKLWNSYHTFMNRLRGWETKEMTVEEYHQAFLLVDFEFAREFLYFEEDRLVGVGLVDLLPQSLSSIYFFHEPALRKQALGASSILSELSYAKALGLDFDYLGYWIAECQSSAYKSQFRPHEILDGFPGDEAEPVWRQI